MKRKVMISAGETSGDRLGAGLARALRKLDPEIDLVGMGGPRMAQAGVRLVQDSEQVSVVGISEVLSRLPQIRRAMTRLEQVLASERPDLLVPIDFPDFNLRLAARARKLDVGVVFFVSPQIWAWRSGRVHRIRRLVREMLVLFEFECEIYRAADVPVTWVGHPLAERPTEAPDRDALRQALGLHPSRPVVGLLPGSRNSEIERLLPVLLATAARLVASRPELQFLIPRAPGVTADHLARMIAQSQVPDIVVSDGPFPEMLQVCTAGAVASGTASLEAAAVGMPMVVIYRMNRLSYWIGRRMIQVEHVAMPNLIAGRRIVPELLQAECRPDRIAAEIARYLDDPEHVAAVQKQLAAVRRGLGPAGIYDRAAARVMAQLESVETP